MDNKYNYSFIIPHKNIPDLLQRCLNSIPRREDVQILVVDDNSDTDKVDFENFPGLDDSNVVVILTKEGKGAGYARNVGLSNAKGKWLLFADADDFFVDGILDSLDFYKNKEFDILFFKACSRDNETLQSIEDDYRVYKLNQYIDKALTTKNFEYLRWSNENVLNVPWCKMINHEMIRSNNIFFEEVPVGNDAMFSVKCAYSSKNLMVIDNKLYCATVRKGSLTQVASNEIMLTRFYGLCRINAFLASINHKEHRYNLIKMSYSYLHNSPKMLIKALKMAFSISSFNDIIHDLYNTIKLSIRL